MNLPIFSYENEIIESVKNNNVTIIEAETGSGKSTQVPQMLYKEGYSVVCTQPRRIAAISLAEYVGSKLGDVVGYSTAFESTRTKDTKVLYCTDGLQVARGVADDDDVLIIDEVHEMTLNIETLLSLTKELYKNGSNKKVVIMSATIDTNRIKKFYQDCTSVGVIKIDTKTYPVETKMISRYDTIKVACREARDGRNILVFQPGKSEIDDFIQDFEYKIGDFKDYVIMPLHAELSVDEQNKAFESYPGKSKVIVSTNVAQTSITIPDIDVVIDTGKERIVESVGGVEGLYEKTISRSDCKQRMGRAGRTHAGTYYLCDEPISKRPEMRKPEIRRLPLDKVVLKMCDLGKDPTKMEFLNHPTDKLIVEAIDFLRGIQAIDENGVITEIGRDMVKLPLSPRFARSISETRKFDDVNLNDVIVFAALIENGPLLRYSKNSLGGNKYSYYDIFDCSLLETYLNSDIICDYFIFAGLENACFGEEEIDCINMKKYKIVKNTVDKIRMILKIDEKCDPTLRSAVFTSNIKRCIVSGNIDMIFTDNYWGWGYTNLIKNDERTYEFSNRNSFNTYSDLFFAVPNTIEVKSMWRTREINILSYVFDLELDDVIDYLKGYITESYDYDNARLIDFKSELFRVQVDFSINGTVIDSTTREVKDPELSKLYFADIFNQKYCNYTYPGALKETKCYTSNYYKSCGMCVIVISDDDLMNVKDIPDYKVEGLTPLFVSDSIFNRCSSISELQEEYTRANKESQRRLREAELINQFESIKITDIDDSFIAKLSESNEAAKEECGKNIGIVQNKSKINACFYLDDKTCAAGEKQTIHALLEMYIQANYPRKKFKERLSTGKKMFSTRSENAYSYFNDLCELIVDDSCLSNVQSSIKMVQDAYEESTKGYETI